MKSSVLIVTATALVAAIAGVAIAGLPSGSPESLTVLGEARPATSAAIAAPIGENDRGSVAASTTPSTVIADTTPSTVDPAPTTAVTSPPTTSTLVVTTTTTIPLVDRSRLVIGIANASGVGGAAGAASDGLEPQGYDATPVDAVDIGPGTLVYYDDGLQGEASRLAVDLGWPAEAIAPLTDMPPLRTERVFALVAVLGTDRPE